MRSDPFSATIIKGAVVGPVGMHGNLLNQKLKTLKISLYKDHFLKFFYSHATVDHSQIWDTMNT